MLPTIQAGYDFVLARLHGLWASGVHGDALENLARSTTEELLLRNLHNVGIDCATRQEFHSYIYDREVSELNVMARMLNNDEAAYYIAVESHVYYENLKTALHNFFFPNGSRTSETKYIVAASMPEFDEQAISSARDARVLAQVLPTYGKMKRNRLEKIVQELNETHDVMIADCKLDCAYFSDVLSSVNAITTKVGDEARRLVAIQIDILNLCMLLRNAQTYHFGENQISELWLPEGGSMNKGRLLELASKENIHEMMNIIGAKYRHVMETCPGTELYKYESALWKYLYKEARRSFFMYDKPEMGIAAFPFLAHFESMNLGRIYEGIYFGIPAQSILEMMIA